MRVSRCILLLLFCVYLLSACGETEPAAVSSRQEAPQGDSNGANYPYDDLDEPQYYGYTIAPQELEWGTLVYHEIQEADLPLYRTLCADGYGKYFPMQALYNRYTVWVEATAAKENEWLRLYRTGDGTFLKADQQPFYEEFLEYFPEIELLCEDIFARQQNGTLQDVLGLHFTSGDAPVFCLSTSVDYHSVCLVSALELSDFGKEMEEFADYMEEISHSKDASELYEKSAAIAYYYQEIHAKGSADTSQRFIYYAWLRKGDREYLLQMTSPIFPVDAKKTKEPDGIDVFENIIKIVC